MSLNKEERTLIKLKLMLRCSSVIQASPDPDPAILSPPPFPFKPMHIYKDKGCVFSDFLGPVRPVHPS
ncbi:hypothetical protein CEXT_116311 [Caerostris extrusa]|uniref:Uncharacterized protein n=1 Tax=Caerostris extrusa TaxID=172846 RepID=A0AAV4WVQ5_CAEEX|nr:hypothetical protein CEXT_116311 [Caerostris extrusa]